MTVWVNCMSMKNQELAERVGFEPTLEFPLNTLSKRAPSATRPSLRHFCPKTNVSRAGQEGSCCGRQKHRTGLPLDSMGMRRQSQLAISSQQSAVSIKASRL